MAFEQKQRMQTAAFIGWQVYISMPSFSKKQAKRKNFKQYLQAMGLAEKGQGASQMSAEESLKLAEENDARARAAFRRKPIQA